jgi:hypothetical protein
MDLVKSVSSSDTVILNSILGLYCPDGFDLDPTYSQGVFYKEVPQPKLKFDLKAQYPFVGECDCRKLPFPAGYLGSIVFDPPFMFGTHGQTKNNIMNKRFSMFDSWGELETMYRESLVEFYRILKVGGVLAFKCQDYTDSQTTLTHCFVFNWAVQAGFKTEDLFILTVDGGRIYNPSLVQRHARKFHSYWFVFRKGRGRK